MASDEILHLIEISNLSVFVVFQIKINPVLSYGDTSGVPPDPICVRLQNYVHTLHNNVVIRNTRLPLGTLMPPEPDPFKLTLNI